MHDYLSHCYKECSSVSTGCLFWLSSLNSFAWSGTDKHKKQSSEIPFSAKISLRVISWESKTNSGGGLYQCGVNSSRHKAHNGLGLKVNSNLIMSSPHLAQLPEFVRHTPHATFVINTWTRSCETTETLEQSPFNCSSSCACFFFCFPLTVSPPSPANNPPPPTPTWSSSFAEKTHFLVSLLNQNSALQTDVERGPTCGFSDTN